MLAGLYTADRHRARKETESVIAEFGLEPIRRKRAGTLSGGWQRRLSIAMALVTRPKILLLDEPTLGLDVLARRELWRIIAELKGKVTVILTTHYLEEAEALCDRIGIMAEGRMCAVGTAEELKRQADTASFEDAFIHIAQGGMTDARGNIC
jgi:ABC-2 type transport system ATP-binding protein